MAPNIWPPIAIAIMAVVVAIYARQLYLAVFPFHLLTAHKYSAPRVITKTFQGRTVLVTGAHGAYGSRAAKLFKDADTLILVCSAVDDGHLLWLVSLLMLELTRQRLTS